MVTELGDGTIHHLMFSQAPAVRQTDQVLIPGYHNGNLRAYGALVPGSVVVFGEDRNLDTSVAAPLDDNLRPLVLPGFSTHGHIGRSLAYARVRSVVRQAVRRAEFVHIQYPGSFGLMAARMAMRMDKAVYVDMHGSLIDPPGVQTHRSLRNRATRALYYVPTAKKLARKARLLIAVSPHLHTTFPPGDVPKVVAPCTLINNEAIYRRDDACTKDALELFVATRLIESKGIHHLLRAVKQLQADSHPVRLKLAGVGEYVPALKQLTAELGLESAVEFLGGIPAGEQLWAHFRSADIAVLPSLGHYEGTPRQIIEAWAAGAPVLATTVGGIPAMVNHEEDGLLVSPGDPQALADAVKRIAGDAELRRRMVANAYKRVESMTFEGRLPILRDAFERYLPGLLPED